MRVEAIHLGKERVPELWTVESVRALAGKGLEGDRHFHEEGAPAGQALTLVEAEVVEDAGLGINADILTDGTIAVGDAVAEL